MKSGPRGLVIDRLHNCPDAPLLVPNMDRPSQTLSKHVANRTYAEPTLPGSLCVWNIASYYSTAHGNRTPKTPFLQVIIIRQDTLYNIGYIKRPIIINNHLPCVLTGCIARLGA